MAARQYELTLVGMLDSPFVRRTAIVFHLMGVEFAHRPVSVYSEQLQELSLLRKVPTLILEDGTVLVNSSNIVSLIEGRVPVERRLWPAPSLEARARALLGMAMLACEKAVEIAIGRREKPLSTLSKQRLRRSEEQLAAALQGLDSALDTREATWLLDCERPTLPDVTGAVAWKYATQRIPDLVERHPCQFLAQHSARAEELPAFKRAAFPALREVERQ